MTGGGLAGFVARDVDSFLGLVSMMTSKGDCSLSLVSLTAQRVNSGTTRGGVLRDALGVRPRAEEDDETRREEDLLGSGFASDGLRLANAIVLARRADTK